MKKSMDFTRTINISTIKVAQASVHTNGELTTINLDDIKAVGTSAITASKAEKLVKKTYKNLSNVLILKIENVEEVRGMSFEDFLEHSEIVERPPSQAKIKTLEEVEIEAENANEN